MTSPKGTPIPQSVTGARGVYDALAILHRRGFAKLDLNAIKQYRDVSDPVKLARLLRGVDTVEELIIKIGRSDSDFRHSIVPSPAEVSEPAARRRERPSFAQPIEPFAGTITRVKEVRGIEVMLRKRTKNNVIVCGEAGSGKTALVEALATLRPDLGPFWRVDPGALVGGTGHRGELEGRLSELFTFASSTKSTIFIDEIHSLARMGVAEGSINVLDVMKPHLVHPDFRVIGATTPEELPFILRDSAFQRRFTVMRLQELSSNQLKDVFDGYISNSETLQPFTGAFSEVMHFVDRLGRPTSHVDALLDFLEHAEAYLALNPIRSTPVHQVLSAAGASYFEFQHLPDAREPDRMEGGER
ncbi:AAA family ATPase [Microbacterium sp. NPDC055988]|uniref:AAA family ATPase n=1 Tax=Microbacterium sp. NPDC055988 TaxID=3345671 RepID=UPI0035E3B68D